MDPHASGQAMNKDDAQEQLVDKMRGGNYDDVFKSAMETSEKAGCEQMCLGGDGSITKADPTKAFKNIQQARQAQAAQIAEAQAPVYNEDEELQKLRAARKAALQTEQNYRRQGHGVLKELANEFEFIGVVKPHERAVVLLDEGGSTATEVGDALGELAKKHLEAQFCRIPLDKAGLLGYCVNIDEGLPMIYILKHGEVRMALPPRRLFEYSSASSPLFARNLQRLLRSCGAIGSGEDKGSSDEDYDSEEEDKQRRRRR